MLIFKDRELTGSIRVRKTMSWGERPELQVRGANKCESREGREDRSQEKAGSKRRGGDLAVVLKAVAGGRLSLGTEDRG